LHVREGALVGGSHRGASRGEPQPSDRHHRQGRRDLVQRVTDVAQRVHVLADVAGAGRPGELRAPRGEVLAPTGSRARLLPHKAGLGLVRLLVQDTVALLNVRPEIRKFLPTDTLLSPHTGLLGADSLLGLALVGLLAQTPALLDVRAQFSEFPLPDSLL